MSGSIPRGTSIVSVQANTACDLACAYCPLTLHAREGPELSRAQFAGVLDAAERAGCEHLALGGGEPTLWPHLPWAVQAARARGFFVAVTTNARDAALARSLGADRLGVSAHKGDWRVLGVVPNAIANVLHLRGGVKATIRTVAEALRVGYRSLALLAYKGPDPRLRATAEDLAVLAWLAGQLRRAGLLVTLDSYTYRRLGLSAGCGQGFARVLADGRVIACCFQDCEFYGDRSQRFLTEQRRNVASRPVREVVVAENSEVGYVVPLSDSLEVSLRHLTWESVLAALDELKRLASILGPAAAQVARTVTPQMSDDGRGPPPMLGTIDLAADEALLQCILDQATAPPLAGRRVEHSVLLRDDDSIDRVIYVDDLANDLAYGFSLEGRASDTLPTRVERRRREAADDLLGRLGEVDYAAPIFGQGFADLVAAQLVPVIEERARSEHAATHRDLATHHWSPTDPELPLWLDLAAAADFDAAASARAYLAARPTLAERLQLAMHWTSRGPGAQWVRHVRDELVAEARRVYTPEGVEAVALAAERAKRAISPFATKRPGTVRVERAVPGRLIAYRRAELPATLRGFLRWWSQAHSAESTAEKIVAAWKQSWYEGLRRFAEADARLAQAVLWDGFPPLVPVSRDQLWNDPPSHYVVIAYGPDEAPDLTALATWAAVALELRITERAKVWLEAAIARLSEAQLLPLLTRAYDVGGPELRARARPLLEEIVGRGGDFAEDARRFLDDRARAEAEWRRLSEEHASES